MLNVLIPNNNLEERKYIINVLLDEFIGVKYTIKERDINNYEIILHNENRIIVEDHFFNNYIDDLSYLKLENIPNNIPFAKNKFLQEQDIPVIFGSTELKISKNVINCGIDIFASSFFMLTRWEEYINVRNDRHGRFPASESLALKNGFLHRPVVNEYIEMLWNMLIFMGIDESRKKRNYKIILTHDIDVLLKYYNLKNGVREFANDLLRKKSVSKLSYHLKQKVKTHFKQIKDPYDMYDFFMKFSEKLNIKSYFFFMVNGTSRFDGEYSLKSKKLKKIIEAIKKRRHNIGIHSSYNSYNDEILFKKEKLSLEDIIGEINYGRSHFLRFEVPITWQIWNDNDMEWDSTLGYADKNGFRCGVCYEFSVFNILSRKKLKLKEKPLLVMDTTYVNYDSNKNDKEVEKDLMFLMNSTKKYNGEFVVLWHNSTIEHKRIWNVFSRVLNEKAKF